VNSTIAGLREEKPLQPRPHPLNLLFSGVAELPLDRGMTLAPEELIAPVLPAIENAVAISHLLRAPGLALRDLGFAACSSGPAQSRVS